MREHSARAIWRRIIWFIALWLAGVLSVSTVSLLVRWALRP